MPGNRESNTECDPDCGARLDRPGPFDRRGLEEGFEAEWNDHFEWQEPGAGDSSQRGISAAPCLVVLLRQIVALNPMRPRTIDGILRDPRVGPPSDHHVGNALDVTAGPLAGFTVHDLAFELVNQMRENPQGGRLSYVIANGEIAMGREGWRWRRYTRTCPHRRHIHLSIKATHRNVVRPWTLRAPVIRPWLLPPA